MSQPPQAGFNPSQNNGRMLVRPADQVAINYCGIIRPLPHLPARRVSILAPPLFGDGVMVDHGVHIAG